MIEQGLRHGWLKPFQIAGEQYEALPEMVLNAMQAAASAGNLRSFMAGAGVMVRMAEANLNLAAQVDKARGNVAPDEHRVTVSYTDRLPQGEME